MITEKQAKLAKQALEYPEYRFKNLYQLMHWQVWIRHATSQVMARSGSSTAGVDGKTRDDFKEDYERHIAIIINRLKDKTYEPQPVRRTYIPKGNGKKRPLGIPILYDRIVQEALRMMLDPSIFHKFVHFSPSLSICSVCILFGHIKDIITIYCYSMDLSSYLSFFFIFFFVSFRLPRRPVRS